jgi:hypothetical protein
MQCSHFTILSVVSGIGILLASVFWVDNGQADNAFEIESPHPTENPTNKDDPVHNAILETHERRPNIVLLVWDDAGLSDNAIPAFQAPGQQSVFHTPYMNTFAADGLVFTRSYASSSVCAASRASLFMGQSAMRHHIRCVLVNVCLWFSDLTSLFVG